MTSFLNKNRYPFLLLAIYLLAEVLVNPLGEFPLNDDWAYTKSLLILTNESRLDIGEWPAMTLVSHILWGALFVKTIGFSFLLLRISTLLSSLIGLMVFFKMIVNLTANKTLAFICALTLLMCPLYFNLSNTFMTDVNFNTLIILSCFFALRYYQTYKHVWVIAFTLVCSALVLMRQFGIVVPFCFLAGAIFLPSKKTIPVLFAFLSLAIVYFAFHWYELYLKSILSATASYKFSGNLKLLDKDFYRTFFDRMNVRWRPQLITISIYMLPLTVCAMPGHIKVNSKVKNLALFLTSAVISILISYNVAVQTGNVFQDMSLGAETFYQSLNDIYGGHRHTWSAGFLVILEIVKYLGLTAMFFCLASFIVERDRMWRKCFSSINVFILLLFTIYILMLFVTESFFDRYSIPAVTLALTGFSILFSANKFSWKPGIVILMLFAYVSVAGTHDYFTVNRIRWGAYDDLRQKAIAPGKINAGFEVNCWDEGNYGWWVNFLTTDNFDYLIQYRSEPGFKREKTFPFLRYFPLKRDTISIYRREGLADTPEE